MAYSEEEKIIRHREAVKRSRAKKQKAEPTQATHDNLMNAAKSFVRNYATADDMEQLDKIYKDRV
ncbi:hypothetical protein [Jeotgalibaca porci]|uniref:hypothetical protein n=1 Tax=Jeotgalibaca porci TaxID=1868793 RepID=UPI00359F2DAC